VLKVALPRPSSDAVFRSDGRSAYRSGFGDEEEAPVKHLSRQEAQALRRRQPPLSPWRVVLAQGMIGAVAAALIGLGGGGDAAVRSALYGAAAVAVPGALMARAATSRLGLFSPLASTASMLGWSLVKTAAAVAMLLLAPRLVQGLSWPVMLATLFACMQTYWLALLWRGRAK
jgi:ATP synthase protein I